MTIRSTALRLVAAWVVVLCCISTRADAQVDLEAESAYLLTGINSGSEVTMPAFEQPVYLHVDYRVVGGTGSFTAVVRALIDGVEHCSGSLEFSANSAQVIWCPGPYIATAGTHTLRWELDSQNQVSESNENNNTVEFTFTTAPEGSHDLEGLAAYLLTEPNAGEEVEVPAPGQEVYFHFDFRVGGAGDPFMASVAATLDGEPYCDGPIEFTPGIDGVVWCPTPYTATEGTHTLEWEIDSEQAISETDETNNFASITFFVGGSGCVGDCDGSDSVRVNELVLGINIALQSLDPIAGYCAAFDPDRSGTVTISELVTGVDNLLRGCP